MGKEEPFESTERLTLQLHWQGGNRAKEWARREGESERLEKRTYLCYYRTALHCAESRAVLQVLWAMGHYPRPIKE